MAIQLDFFQIDAEDVEYLKRKIEETKESSDKVRKGLFARHNELAKMYVELSERVQVMERNICKP